MNIWVMAQSISGDGGGGFLLLAIQLVLIFAVFYFFIIRPQTKKAKAHQEKIESVRKNDRVITAGGIVGRVVKVDDNEVELEIAKDVRVRVIKGTLQDIREKGPSKADKG